MKNKTSLLFMFVLFLIHVIINHSILVYAGEGGASGGGGYEGCGWNIDTCYGATWVWYPTDSDYVMTNGYANPCLGEDTGYAGEYSEYHDPRSDGYVNCLKRKSDYTRAYAFRGPIIGCAAAGGYWRYAMVDRDRYDEQRGLIGIGSDDPNFRSIWFFAPWERNPNRQMNYFITRPEKWKYPEMSDEAHWNMVKTEYEKVKKEYPDIYKLGWNGSSALSWFCAENPNTKLFSSSTVSVNPGSVIANTGIKDEEVIETTDDVYLRAGETRTISFAHNIYANNKNNNVEWEVKKDFKKNGEDFSLGDGTGGATSGTADITNSFSGHDTAKYISTVSPQFADEYNDHKFSEVGAYSFCESIKVKNKKLTGVCTNIFVPYNYINTTTIDISRNGTDKNYVYAGEQFHVNNVTVEVGKRQNNTVGGEYATQVEDVEVAMVIYTSNNDAGSALADYGNKNTNLCNAVSSRYCYYSSDSNIKKEKLNANANIEGATEIITELSGKNFNNYDEVAGKYLCAVSAVYPYSSGYDLNMNKSGSDSWYISAPSCIPVAKKPSVSIYGGSLYTASNIKTNASEKRNLSGIAGREYDPITNNTTVFGSFTELSINSPNGRVFGLASGASTGSYNSNNSRTPIANLGGSYESNGANFCIRSPLSFPNSNCAQSNQGSLFGRTSYFYEPKDKELLTNRYSGSNGASYQNITSAEYLFNSEPVTITKGTTRVIRAENSDVIIGADVTYEDNYGAISEIPKLIIYAKNIRIACGVQRIDAILIANGNINTCADSDDINKAINSNQIKINGTIISDTVNFNRTYGSATGYNSEVPAEVINYDSTIFLWGASQATSGSAGKYETTYQQELSPRY